LRWPQLPPSFKTFTIPNAGISTLTSGPDGALWFSESAGNKVARITTAGFITEFPVPTA
jgi:virginiamycin B lyase